MLIHGCLCIELNFVSDGILALCINSDLCTLRCLHTDTQLSHFEFNLHMYVSMWL